ncbi:hypothetical protein E3T26_01000 [Cryobacterium sp. TMT1-21]|uniref:Uncharacterized protein n=1 Tax=Cryobacterium shii TaxID=1259235 RepID=A0AAQ2HF33_9MICO|nr:MULTISPECIES: hypothetical protein [Cryobacterium]TFC44353.1 hypothetical protein E3O49_11935 [Cryobacterium shii]TFC88423.1 hypothetical protein E3T24_02815 [Cryobacterium sp. TmT2-59]TFD17903.1 hypothetical protein E3T26_01000 [Cryobacterium sp. TMT1-21]TFD20930.1 hypothetical protein E3T42_01160 [Cryobacterium sp. TMT4-10]TFD35796.1 hypothetical protein E3T37_14885 [Cryobacterium sp. TMT2-10]
MKTVVLSVAGILSGALFYALLGFSEGGWAGLFSGAALLSVLPRMALTILVFGVLLLGGLMLPRAFAVGVTIGMMACFLVGLGLLFGNPETYTLGDPYQLYLLSRGPRNPFIWFAFLTAGFALVAHISNERPASV